MVGTDNVTSNANRSTKKHVNTLLVTPLCLLYAFNDHGPCCPRYCFLYGYFICDIIPLTYEVVDEVVAQADLRKLRLTIRIS